MLVCNVIMLFRNIYMFFSFGYSFNIIFFSYHEKNITFEF